MSWGAVVNSAFGAGELSVTVGTSWIANEGSASAISAKSSNADLNCMQLLAYFFLLLLSVP